jgi:hypothetical protein
MYGACELAFLKPSMDCTSTHDSALGVEELVMHEDGETETHEFNYE